MELYLLRPATSLSSPDNAGTPYPDPASKPGISLWCWGISGLPCGVSPLSLRLYTVCLWMVRYLGNSYTEDWSLLQKFWSLSGKSNKKEGFTKRFLSSYSEFLPKTERTSTAMQNSKIYVPDFLLSVFGRFYLGLDSFDNQAGSSWENVSFKPLIWRFKIQLWHLFSLLQLFNFPLLYLCGQHTMKQFSNLTPCISFSVLIAS